MLKDIILTKIGEHFGDRILISKLSNSVNIKLHNGKIIMTIYFAEAGLTMASLFETTRIMISEPAFMETITSTIENRLELWRSDKL